MSASSYSTILYAVRNRVATITLNRPETRNAFNALMRRELGEAVAAALADENVRVVVLTGTGPTFSAGADLMEMGTPDFLPQPQIEQEYKPVLMAIAQAHKPFISAINGVAAGVGSAFAMVCDLTVMADDASFYQAFVAIGLVPDGGATWQLAQVLGRKRAYEVMTSGARLPAAQCLDWGLANRVVPAASLGEAAQAWAEELADKAPLSLRYTKQALNQVTQLNLADAITYEAGLQNYCVRSQDAKEGVMAFMSKRKPEFQGK